MLVNLRMYVLVLLRLGALGYWGIIACGINVFFLFCSQLHDLNSGDAT